MDSSAQPGSWTILAARLVALFVAVGCGRTEHDSSGTVGSDSSLGGASTSAGGAQASDATAIATSSASGPETGASTGGIAASGAGGASTGAGGTQGSAAGGAAPGLIDLSGNWAMFHFEDPVAVSLQQRGTELSGTGCCGGLVDSTLCCAPIAGGSLEGRHVQFSFPVDIGSGVYAIDGYVSEDGTRMAGPFHHLGGWGSPTAWVRIAEGEAWLPSPDVDLSGELEERWGWFVLALASDEAVGAYSPGESYSVAVTASSRSFVSGDLGSFWEAELSWSAAEETLTAGPVPETHPDLPTELRFDYEDTVLVEVTATLPSGDEGRFTPSPL